MKTLTKKDYQKMLVGSQFYGTGGGGNPKEAEIIYQKIVNSGKNIKLCSLNEFKENDLLITAFGVGPITSCGIPEKQITKGFQLLNKITKQKPSGIIPVEIGPKSLATACLLANQLGLPLVDADFVGGRSTPEVFLETITLFGIPRSPAAIVDYDDNSALLCSSQGPLAEEKFFRDFGNINNKGASVVGYPISCKTAKTSLAQNTVSQSIYAGKMLIKKKINELLQREKGKVLYEGKIIKINKADQKGFTTRYVAFSNLKNKKAKLFIKNESLILWVNNKVVLTCPDLITMLDKKNRPIYNDNLKSGSEIMIIGLPSVKLWKTKKGLELFNPRLFGFKFNNKLL